MCYIAFSTVVFVGDLARTCYRTFTATQMLAICKMIRRMNEAIGRGILRSDTLRYSLKDNHQCSYLLIDQGWNQIFQYFGKSFFVWTQTTYVENNGETRATSLNIFVFLFSANGTESSTNKFKTAVCANYYKCCESWCVCICQNPLLRSNVENTLAPAKNLAHQQLKTLESYLL